VRAAGLGGAPGDAAGGLLFAVFLSCLTSAVSGTVVVSK